MFLDPWQELAVLVILAEASNGNWAAFETAVLVARQNGKGEIILVLELAGLFLLGEKLLLHSAHEFKTSKEAYLRIKGVIEGAPHLSRLVKQFRQSNEDTSVELTSGARLRFMARSRQSGRGFSAQRLLVDEAQILPFAAMGALMPTLSAQQNPQINYFGTVPRPEDNSEHFTQVRDRGRGGDDPYLAWLEFNLGTECDDLDDREAWGAANPAMGYRINELFIAKERASLSAEDFARERLSIWADDSNAERWEIVTKAQWSECKTAETGKRAEKPGWLKGPVALGIELPPDRSAAAIGAAGECREGGIGLEVYAYGPDVGWVVPKIVELTADKTKPISHVVIDPGSPAGALIVDLEAAGVTVTQCKYGDLVRATGDLYDGIVDGEVVHRDRDVLNAAVATACKRNSGDAWLLDRRGDTDISPFGAVNLARWGHLQPVAPPPYAAAVYA